MRYRVLGGAAVATLLGSGLVVLMRGAPSAPLDTGLVPESTRTAAGDSGPSPGPPAAEATDGSPAEPPARCPAHGGPGPEGAARLRIDVVDAVTARAIEADVRFDDAMPDGMAEGERRIGPYDHRGEPKDLCRVRVEAAGYFPLAGTLPLPPARDRMVTFPLAMLRRPVVASGRVFERRERPELTAVRVVSVGESPFPARDLSGAIPDVVDRVVRRLEEQALPCPDAAAAWRAVAAARATPDGQGDYSLRLFPGCRCVVAVRHRYHAPGPADSASVFATPEDVVLPGLVLGPEGLAALRVRLEAGPEARLVSLQCWRQRPPQPYWWCEEVPGWEAQLAQLLRRPPVEPPELRGLRFDGLRPGPKRLWLRPLGAALAPALLDVELRPNAITDAVVAFPAARAIRGGILDPAGVPCPGARVRAAIAWQPCVENAATEVAAEARRGRVDWRWKSSTPERIEVTTTSDAEGRFELRGLPVEPVVVTIDVYGERVFDRRVPVEETDLQVEANVLRPEIVATVITAAPLDPMWRRAFRGSVWSLFDVEVCGFGAFRETKRLNWPEPVQFVGVPDGRVQVVCIGGARHDAHREVSVGEALVRRGTTQLVALQSSGSAHAVFRVADHVTGTPIPVAVRTTVLGREVEAESYGSGWIQHSIAAGVPLALELSSTGYRPRSVPVRAVPGEVIELGWLCLEPVPAGR